MGTLKPSSCTIRQSTWGNLRVGEFEAMLNIIITANDCTSSCCLPCLNLYHWSTESPIRMCPSETHHQSELLQVVV